MTIQDLGSLEEIIAAIATVATLVYLAIQVRASNRLSRAEASRTPNSDLISITGNYLTSSFVRDFEKQDELDPSIEAAR